MHQANHVGQRNQHREHQDDYQDHRWRSAPNARRRGAGALPCVRIGALPNNVGRFLDVVRSTELGFGIAIAIRA